MPSATAGSPSSRRGRRIPTGSAGESTSRPGAPKNSRNKTPTSDFSVTPRHRSSSGTSSSAEPKTMPRQSAHSRRASEGTQSSDGTNLSDNRKAAARRPSKSSAEFKISSKANCPGKAEGSCAKTARTTTTTGNPMERNIPLPSGGRRASLGSHSHEGLPRYSSHSSDRQTGHSRGLRRHSIHVAVSPSMPRHSSYAKEKSPTCHPVYHRSSIDGSASGKP